MKKVPLPLVNVQLGGFQPLGASVSNVLRHHSSVLVTELGVDSKFPYQVSWACFGAAAVAWRRHWVDLQWSWRLVLVLNLLNR